MSEEAIETINVELRSYKLNKNLLEDLATIVNDEYGKAVSGTKNDWERDYIKLTYTLKIKNKEKATKEIQNFLKQWDPKNFKNFEIYFRDSKKSITIRCGDYWNLNVSVSGNDSTWVSGLTKKIEEVLDKYRSKNEFFHKPQAYVIYLGISFPIGFFISMIVTTSIGVPILDSEISGENIGISNTPPFGTIAIIFAIVVNLTMGCASLFHWLFPKMELESSNRPKIRNTILSIISMFIISLFAGWVFYYIKIFN